MINEKVEIDVYGRRLTLQIEGLTQLELNALSQQLTERMEKVFRDSDLADSHKLAIVTALQILDEMSRLKVAQETLRVAEDRLLDQMAATLQDALERSKP
ncbi:MAG: cell division protein ZapA [Elusimicrobia bacterium]|nr:cell division protein ZapA [Elusimicrobiota bacterium]